MAELVILTGENKGLRYPLEEKLVIGRSSENALPISDKKASRRHSCVFRRGSHYFIQDLQSRNGTLVNGQKITQEQLAHGDHIVVGSTEFQFVALASSPAKTSCSPPSSAPLQPQVKKAPLKAKDSKKRTSKARSWWQRDWASWQGESKLLLIVVLLLFVIGMTWLSRWITLMIIQ